MMVTMVMRIQIMMKTEGGTQGDGDDSDEDTDNDED